MNAIIILLIALFVIWYFNMYIQAAIRLFVSSEHYLPCSGCGNTKIPDSGLTVINPFIWPYSGSACTNDLYMQKETDKLTSSPVPLTNPSTPDHALLTN